MLHCLPQCPTVRRQLREEVRKAGWTDEYLRKVIDAHSVEIGDDLDPAKIYRKEKPVRRKTIHKVPLSHRKQRVTSKDLEHDDRYKEKRYKEEKRYKDYPDKIVQDSIPITDYKEIIDDDDEKPVATLKQETVYYTEEKEIAHVAPLVERVSPSLIKRPQIKEERDIESSIEDQKLISYEEEKVNDNATIYSKTEIESSIEDQRLISYEEEKVNDNAAIYSTTEIESSIEDQRLISYEKEKVNDNATIYSKTEIESSNEDQKLISYEKEKVNDNATIYSKTEIESSIKDQKLISYEKEKVNDNATIYSKTEIESSIKDQKQIDYKKVNDNAAIYSKTESESSIEDQKQIDYEKVNDNAAIYSKTESESSIEDQKQINYEKEKVVDTKIIYSSSKEKPGTSKIVNDKGKIQSRDDSPDNYYKYTPEKLPSDWPHDGCDQNCPAKILKERAEKLLEEKQKYMEDRYLRTGLSYFEDVCTCSLGCMVDNLRKDRFVRRILTSAIFFAFGIKLCSELYGWYLPNRT